MKKILFVCTGNTCRSPMAAGLMNKMLIDAGISDVIAESAGLSAQLDAPASQNAVDAAKEVGVDLASHRARPAFSLDLAQYDDIYAMTPRHALTLEAAEPKLRDRVCVLGEGIPDPFGGSLAEYRSCRDVLQKALEPILRELQKDG